MRMVEVHSSPILLVEGVAWNVWAGVDLDHRVVGREVPDDVGRLSVESLR